MRSLLALSAVLGALTACSENGFVHTTDGSDLGPEIEVDPLRLDFGTATEGEEILHTFNVKNVGSTDLHVEGIELEGGSFAILTQALDFMLPPGATQPIEVAFYPIGANEQLGWATVFSNDASDPAVEVDLIGFGAVPELVIDPDPYDFGVDYIGCGNGHEFALTNAGTDDLVIEAIAYESDGQLVMTDTNTVPLTLEPGASTSVWIDFMPAVEGATDGDLVVLSNDPRGEVVATQKAEGRYAAKAKDEFEIPVNPPVDIIFAVDQSCSMDDDISRLGSNFTAFITDIGLYTSDWRIGVATADNGCFNGGILKSTTSDYVSKFKTAVGGSFGNWTEALLTVSTNALGQTGTSGCNAGFLRPDALLHLILVSDEPEQSSKSWSHYVTLAQSYKSDPGLLKISAVAGDYPSGCSTADPGTGYHEAVTATGGEYLSICATDWAKHVEKLATASLSGLYDFELTQTPDPASIRVWVNGTEWTSDWHYDAPTNEVQFDVQLDSGAVTVTYGVLVSCD